eukprot:357715-Chlamydomonas_euryale.AAC.3
MDVCMLLWCIGVVFHWADRSIRALQIAIRVFSCRPRSVWSPERVCQVVRDRWMAAVEDARCGTQGRPPSATLSMHASLCAKSTTAARPAAVGSAQWSPIWPAAAGPDRSAGTVA